MTILEYLYCLAGDLYLDILPSPKDYKYSLIADEPGIDVDGQIPFG